MSTERGGLQAVALSPRRDSKCIIVLVNRCIKCQSTINTRAVQFIPTTSPTTAIRQRGRDIISTHIILQVKPQQWRRVIKVNNVGSK